MSVASRYSPLLILLALPCAGTALSSTDDLLHNPLWLWYTYSLMSCDI